MCSTVLRMLYAASLVLVVAVAGSHGEPGGPPARTSAVDCGDPRAPTLVCRVGRWSCHATLLIQTPESALAAWEADAPPGTGPTRLDAGHRIDPSSLRLSGSRLSWLTR